MCRTLSVRSDMVSNGANLSLWRERKQTISPFHQIVQCVKDQDFPLTKAHVKHAICLVKYQIRHSLQICRLPPHQVNQTTLCEGCGLAMTSWWVWPTHRGGHDDFATLLDGIGLFPFAAPSIHTCDCQVVGLAKLTSLVVDLERSHDMRVGIT